MLRFFLRDGCCNDAQGQHTKRLASLATPVIFPSAIDGWRSLPSHDGRGKFHGATRRVSGLIGVRFWPVEPRFANPATGNVRDHAKADAARQWPQTPWNIGFDAIDAGQGITCAEAHDPSMSG